MNLLAQLAWVAGGGALGAMCRYAVNLWAVTVAPSFPLATMAVNASGALMAGALWIYVTELSSAHAAARLFGAVGFLGAFTTFSAFSLETLLLWQQGQLGTAAINVVLNVILSLACCAFGLALGRWLLTV